MTNTRDDQRLNPARLRIAIQKKGRLGTESLELLKKAGITLSPSEGGYFCESSNFPLELLLVRDDDIAKYVTSGTCDIGIVGQNVLEETQAAVEQTDLLGFGACRFSLAAPMDREIKSIYDLNGLRVATSYPHWLGRLISNVGVKAELIELSGSVELAPKIGLADAIADLVSSGATLKANALEEKLVLFKSQAVLIRAPSTLSVEKNELFARLRSRIQGVRTAGSSKYIMMNTTRDCLEEIKRILPGMESPSILQLGDSTHRIAVHAVAREEIFWDTMERLKKAGASSILVLPIEKVIL